ncbi:chemotaxis response regulator protein-glutamate methylesterase [Pseudoalteromonas sp. McH1-7]|uniref:Protein-glutamate methylesterase/protein-glutamine glutaminase n=1 Tax=Pseudoalteromonas peptidolytica F12-50-A1 TaxID=1315280 RepID=A0A8I0MZ56_9GAMM|nr:MULTISPECIES: chemotaxis response regulator protein-glutamate methylesterase [Pseudoalteromonas]MBE0347800.1 two-component system, chemotaxis family, response regulator CheB [Pseudoalteromonas peptidolytica F12-50-A1]MDW7551457.1 chemotaxis response regulator protein-glutamate methylesterase [Pseudoalteromonas peptidolytica]NLR17178.1 chemotaxis response regulator protein-glutamate methylesterase [Pseudoalteromonas peptidolytica]NUZ13017.1 chemotaxis response regulator protein-glutamate meth
MVKVLIVDDSPLIRGLLKEILNQGNGIEVVGVAEDPYQARELIKSTAPDVLTLDIEMPRMNGISFLKNLMRLRPMPVVMISTLTQEGSPATIEALELGAVDFVSKPTSHVIEQLQSYSDILQKKVKVAAKARVRTFKAPKSERQLEVGTSFTFAHNAILAIGASTGGTEAIREVLMRLPTHAPPVVITQHIPPVFSTSFAQRMDRTCAVSVKEAEDGDMLKPGHVFIAPGDKHLKVERVSSGYVCRLDDGEPVNRHKPSVEVLFNSLVPIGKHVCAVMLTGMGSDGAKAMLALKKNGAKTFAQDELSSVVWGMPRAAYELGAVQSLVPLSKVAETMLDVVKK